LEKQKITTPDAGSNTQFGMAIDLSGDTAVVGSADDSLGLPTGAAYVLERQGEEWVEVAKLLPLDGSGDDEFGSAVAISGDTIAVGAPFHFGAGVRGAVYLFERDAGGPGAWGQVLKLRAPNMDSDQFGIALAIDGDTLAIGEPVNLGVVYLLERDGSDPYSWNPVGNIPHPDPGFADRFGEAIALDGDTIVIGADKDDDPQDSGSAWIFERDLDVPDTWGLAAKLAPPDADFSNTFGRSVAVNGTTVAVGARNGNGSVYLYKRDEANSWRLDQKISNSSDGLGSIGEALDLNGDTLVVGKGTAGSGYSDRVYVFRRDGSKIWREYAKLLTSDLSYVSGFGEAVAIDGDTILVAERYDDDLASNSGAVFTYLPERPLSLAVNGACSGSPEVSVSGATPGGLVTLLASQRKGSSTLDAGPCSGLATSLDDPLRILDLSIGEDGQGSGVLDVAPLECGSLLQALDSETCEITGRETIDQVKTGIEAKILDPVPSSFHTFASAIDLEGNRAFIGNHSDSELGLSTGSAWIFERDGSAWSEPVQITAPNPLVGSHFGTSVSLSGDIAVAGAPGKPNYYYIPGEAWVFERNAGGVDQWGAVVELSASDTVDENLFGEAVAAAGDLIAIGAPGIGSGSVYLYSRDLGGPGNWGELTKIEPPDGASNDQFGAAVALMGTVLVVGSPWDDDFGNGSGSAYVFEAEAGRPDAWGITAKLTASNGKWNDNFGTSVATDGETIVVGAPSADPIQTISGLAYVFQRDDRSEEWNEIAFLAPADADERMQFGETVHFDGESILVGEPNLEAGSAYLFSEVNGQWMQSAKLTAPDGLFGDRFGSAVAIDGDTLLVSSSDGAGPDNNWSSAYVYRWSLDSARATAIRPTDATH